MSKKVAIPLPHKKYNVIYADPPWEYYNKNTGGNWNSGAGSKYSTLTTEEICAIEIPGISATNSALFLWVTVPLLPDGIRVMSNWGFKYKTIITWRKLMRSGMGFWFRIQTEHLLLGVKGKVRAFRMQRPNFIQSKVLRHSEKPEEFRALIEDATQNMKPCKKIELFARKRVPGWDAWGNEVDIFAKEISTRSQRSLPFEDLKYECK